MSITKYFPLMKTGMNNSTPDQTVKPFLKWAGGKGQLLNSFYSFYPDELKNGLIDHYYEPFLGSGAVFFDVVQKFNIRSAVLFDINRELVLTWQVIQQDVLKLVERLGLIREKYEKLSDEGRTKLYYKTRDEFNKNIVLTDFSKYNDAWILRAAHVIFLNKTCYNGLFRFNSKGEFNVPEGKYNNPKIFDKQNLFKISELLKTAEIKNAGFEEVEKYAVENSFVYYDPPYRPISSTSQFTAYSKFKFEDNEQHKLAELFKKLDKKGIKQMLSNSDPKNYNEDDNFFDNLYDGYKIARIPARRMINSVASKRTAINEIIVTNY